MVSVQFEQPTYTYDETDGSAQVCLVKDAETATSFTVDNIVTEDGTAMGELLLNKLSWKYRKFRV